MKTYPYRVRLAGGYEIHAATWAEPVVGGRVEIVTACGHFPQKDDEYFLGTDSVTCGDCLALDTDASHVT